MTDKIFVLYLLHVNRLELFRMELAFQPPSLLLLLLLSHRTFDATRTSHHFSQSLNIIIRSNAPTPLSPTIGRWYMSVPHTHWCASTPSSFGPIITTPPQIYYIILYIYILWEPCRADDSVIKCQAPSSKRFGSCIGANIDLNHESRSPRHRLAITAHNTFTYFSVSTLKIHVFSIVCAAALHGCRGVQVCADGIKIQWWWRCRCQDTHNECYSTSYSICLRFVLSSVLTRYRSMTRCKYVIWVAIFYTKPSRLLHTITSHHHIRPFGPCSVYQSHTTDQIKPFCFIQKKNRKCHIII